MRIADIKNKSKTIGNTFGIFLALLALRMFRIHRPLPILWTFGRFRSLPERKDSGRSAELAALGKFFIFFYFFRCEKANALGRGWLFVSPVKLFNASIQDRKFSEILVDLYFQI